MFRTSFISKTFYVSIGLTVKLVQTSNRIYFLSDFLSEFKNNLECLKKVTKPLYSECVQKSCRQWIEYSNRFNNVTFENNIAGNNELQTMVDFLCKY